MYNKIKLLIQILSLSLVMQSCSFDDNNINYEEKLVVFASINSGFPVYDTVFVSRTAEVNESVDSEYLYIEEVQVYQEEEDFESKYLAMLSAGGTLRHKELLAPFGLDASNPEFWSRGLDIISGFVDQLEAEF